MAASGELEINTDGSHESASPFPISLITKEQPVSAARKAFMEVMKAFMEHRQKEFAVDVFRETFEAPYAKFSDTPNICAKFTPLLSLSSELTKVHSSGGSDPDWSKTPEAAWRVASTASHLMTANRKLQLRDDTRMSGSDFLVRVVHDSESVDTAKIVQKDNVYCYVVGGAYGSGIRSAGVPPILPPKIIRGGVCYVSHQKRVGTTCAQVIAQNQTAFWIFDSAASYSVTGNRANLLGIHAAGPAAVSVANGQTMSSNHCGRTYGNVSLSGVRYFPGAPDLISAGHLTRLGCYTMMNEHGVIIAKGGTVVGYGSFLGNNTYSLDFLEDRFLGTICSCCPWPHSHGNHIQL